MTEKKRCNSCGEWKPKTSEYFHREGKRYLKASCKICRNGGLSSSDKTALDKRKNGKHKRSMSNSKSYVAHGQAKVRQHLSNVFVGAFLVAIFVGGFALSSLNGAFAFIDTAKSLSSEHGILISGVVAMVLTGCTAVSFHLFLSVQRFRKLLGFGLFLFFCLTQSINLTINWQGVNKQQVERIKNQVQAENGERVSALEKQIQGYQEFIDTYPATDKLGRPVTWKNEVTQAVLRANKAKQELTKRIAGLSVSAEPEPDWRITAAWVLIPELCMVISLIAFVVRKE